MEASDEILIDGKGIYEGVEYYRIAYKEGYMLDYQMIIPAEYLTAEK